MAEMKSIYQVPVTKDFVDLHYLIAVSSPKLDYASHHLNSSFTIKISLHYRLSPLAVDIVIHPMDLFSESEIKNAGNKLVERSIRKFEDSIRLPLVRKWEEYRKHMIE